jgi:hypothetical protein
MKPRMLLFSVLFASAVPSVVIGSGGMDSVSLERRQNLSSLEQNKLPQSGKQSREGLSRNDSGSTHGGTDQDGPGDGDRALLRELAEGLTSAPSPRDAKKTGVVGRHGSP